MFSTAQKREIADAVQKILRNTKHVELPEGEIQFTLHVDGAAAWSWADICNNGAVNSPVLNPWNEEAAKLQKVEDENSYYVKYREAEERVVGLAHERDHLERVVVEKRTKNALFREALYAMSINELDAARAQDIARKVLQEVDG